MGLKNQKIGSLPAEEELMPKKVVFILICAALLFSFTGCIRLSENARISAGVSETPQASEETPAPTAGGGELLPLEVFTSSIEYSPPDISGDGSMILYRHITSTSDDIIAEDCNTGKQTFVGWPEEAAGIPYYSWAPDSETVLFFVDKMGDENYGLYTSNIKTGETKTVLPAGGNNCYYIADAKDNDKEIYVELMDFNRQLFDLYLLNYITGVKTLVLKNPGNITAYMFDNEGNFRGITTNDESAGKHAFINTGFNFDTTEFLPDDWKEILSWGYEDADTSGVRYFMSDGKQLVYSDSSKSNTNTYYYYDIATGQSAEIYNDPDYDISGSWVDLTLNKVTALSVYGQKTEWHVLDSSFQDDYDSISKNGTDFDIYDSSSDDAYWIVAYVSDVKETDYYLYDMAKHELKFLYNTEPGLGQYKFAQMEPFSYTAGDGLRIEGYATFPQGEEKKDLPAVVLVHGGPASRDIWGYSPEVQLLASRGYLVLQINFRGSTGYGKDFMRTGDLEWGGKMHQDILDGVKYAVNEGWADPERIGVYGASYGGYEALTCAAFSSDVFKCAVDAFGPSSLITLIDSIPPQWSLEREGLMKSVGNPDTDEELMKSRSPLYYAKDMKIPLLIAQGENDVRVTQQQSDQMVEALKDAGIPVTYLLFPNTGHGFNNNKDRMTFYSAMEKFFAENLGGKAGEN